MEKASGYYCMLSKAWMEYIKDGKKLSYEGVRVNTNFFCQSLYEFCRRIRAAWDKKNKQWVISFSKLRYFYVFCTLKKIKVNFDFDVQKVEKWRLECKASQPEVDAIHAYLGVCGWKRQLPPLLPQDHVFGLLQKKPFKYQQEGIAWGYKTGFKCLIADEMGLGKTLQAIGCIAALQANRVLIICPASVCFVWESEISQALGLTEAEAKEQIAVVKGVKTEAPPPPVKYLITSFASGRENIANLIKHGLDLIIVDEAHNLKNEQTKQAKAILPIIAACPHAIALTGTPALNKVEEMYSLCQALKFDAFKGRKDYMQSSAKKIMETIKAKIMIRRLKDEVLKDLPLKTRSHFLVNESDLDLTQFEKMQEKIEKQIKKYDDEFDELRDELIAKYGRGRAEVELAKAYQKFEKALEGSAFEAFKAAGEAKADFLSLYIKDYLSSTQDPVIVFYHHKTVGDALQKKLKDTPLMRIDGNTLAKDRQGFVEGFQGGEYKVALLSLLACNSGITLTKASHIVFGELWWTPSTLLQAESRAHRIGQEKPVTCQYVLAKGTYDDDMYKLIQRKWAEINTILDDDKNETIKAAKTTQGSVMRDLIRNMIQKHKNLN